MDRRDPQTASPPWPLEPSPAEMRRMLDAAARRVVDHIASLGDQRASDTSGGAEAAAALRREPPTAGRDLENLLAQLFDELVPPSFNAAGPGYLAFVPGGGLFHAAVADFVADAINRYVGVWGAAPALAQLEANVVGWFCRWMGLPERAGGFLTTGGSLATLSAVITARSERLGERFLDGVVYVSDQVHHCVTKAAVLAGLPAGQVRRLPSDDRFRLRAEPVAEALRRDRARGLRPFLLVASAGTTNTGAVDDLPALADLAAAEGLWLHADAAYGGFFMLTGRGRRRLAGLERADSITLDPHKGLFLPFGTGCLLARDRAALLRTHAATDDYMPDLQEPDLQDEGERIDFCNVSPELSRDFRGLRVWLPLEMHGVGTFEAALDEKLDLAAWATEELRGMAQIEIVAEPQLTVVAFRLTPAGVEGEALDSLNRSFLAAINRRQRVFLTGTTVRGRFVVRICVLSFRTHRDRVEACLEDVRAAAEEVLGRAR